MIDFNSNVILTAVIPVKNFNENRDTLQVIIKDCIALPITLVVVLDSDDAGELNSLNNLITNLQNSRVRTIFRKFNSPGFARNSGIEITNTPWLAFWDADDSPIPELYLEMISISEKEDTNICIGSYQTFNYLTQEINVRETNTENKFDWLINPGMWRCVFRTSTVQKTRFNSARLGEDIQFISEVIAQSDDWSFFKPVVYQYVTNRNGQATSTKTTKKELSYTFSQLLRTAQHATPNNYGLYMLISARLLTIFKYPKAYFLCLKLLLASLLDGNIDVASLMRSSRQVVRLKAKQKGV
jgi:glycosyltransferase involved in cell wall biosynthesis